MEQFSQTIQTPQGFMNFYFTKMFSDEVERFHVSVVERSKRIIIFNMEREDGGRWHIVKADANPYWLVEIEEKLLEAIVQNTSGR